jgi:hypothetical protein
VQGVLLGQLVLPLLTAAQEEGSSAQLLSNEVLEALMDGVFRVPEQQAALFGEVHGAVLLRMVSCGRSWLGCI